ncbi:MAG: YggS family pyridoxal phosphate-dependent enzyme [Oscillospiraceae bacterium]|nr:YggS family pyridoxal phosphate-dependent enzyme [Oscillospiraceae bacterium]
MNREFEDISENIKRIRFNLEEAKVRAGREHDDIKVMAVTKTVPPERVNFAVSQGFDLLGENRVQEYLSKKELYADNVRVDIIGHLQSNKIKYIIDSVAMIQSVDSVSLAEEISARAIKYGRVMDILCEVNIGGEASKSGFSPEELSEGIAHISQLQGVRLCGLMTIPPPGNSCLYFEKMQRIFEDIKASPPANSDFKLLSMGMSADYADAVKFGTGMVRLGSALFGARNYNV